MKACRPVRGPTGLLRPGSRGSSAEKDLPTRIPSRRGPRVDPQKMKSQQGQITPKARGEGGHEFGWGKSRMSSVTLALTTTVSRGVASDTPRGTDLLRRDKPRNLRSGPVAYLSHAPAFVNLTLHPQITTCDEKKRSLCGSVYPLGFGYPVRTQIWNYSALTLP
jgi:hypothetical protein